MLRMRNVFSYTAKASRYATYSSSPLPGLGGPTALLPMGPDLPPLTSTGARYGGLTASVSSRLFSSPKNVPRAVSEAVPVETSVETASRSPSSFLDDALSSLSLDSDEEALLSPSLAATPATRAAAALLEKRLSQYDDSLVSEYAHELAGGQQAPQDALKALAAAASLDGKGETGAGEVLDAATAAAAAAGLVVGSGEYGLGAAAAAPVRVRVPTAPSASSTTTATAVATGSGSGSNDAALGVEETTASGTENSVEDAESLFGMPSLSGFAPSFPETLHFTGTEHVQWLPPSSHSNPFAFPVLDVGSLCVEPDEVVMLAHDLEKVEDSGEQISTSAAFTSSSAASTDDAAAAGPRSLAAAYAQFDDVQRGLTSDGGILSQNPAPNANAPPGSAAAAAATAAAAAAAGSKGTTKGASLKSSPLPDPTASLSPAAPGNTQGTPHRQSIATFPRPLLLRYPVPRHQKDDIAAIFVAPMPASAAEAVAEEQRRAARSKGGPGESKGIEDIDPAAASEYLHATASARPSAAAGAKGGPAAGTPPEAARPPPVRVAQRAAFSGGRFDVYLAGAHGTTLFFASRAGVAAKGALRVTAAAIERHHVLGLARQPRLVELPPELAQAEADGTRARGGRPGQDPEEIVAVLEVEVAYASTTYAVGDPYGEPSTNVLFRAREADFLVRSVVFGVHLPAPVPPSAAHAVDSDWERVAGAATLCPGSPEEEQEGARRRALTGRLCMALYGQGANVASTRSPTRHPAVAARELESVQIAVLYGDPRQLFPAEGDKYTPPKPTARQATEEAAAAAAAAAANAASATAESGKKKGNKKGFKSLKAAAKASRRPPALAAVPAGPSPAEIAAAAARAAVPVRCAGGLGRISTEEELEEALARHKGGSMVTNTAATGTPPGATSSPAAGAVAGAADAAVEEDEEDKVE